MNASLERAEPGRRRLTSAVPGRLPNGEERRVMSAMLVVRDLGDGSGKG